MANATDDSYVMGTGADAGTTRITEKEIRARTPGSGDVNQLLKALPTIQFRSDEFLATREGTSRTSARRTSPFQAGPASTKTSSCIETVYRRQCPCRYNAGQSPAFCRADRGPARNPFGSMANLVGEDRGARFQQFSCRNMGTLHPVAWLEQSKTRDPQSRRFGLPHQHPVLHVRRH
ncbi:hypothetical protein [Sphingobium yanoikuyae]|uniref:hypothetical protein n=1 Tax=Sphingobium yanoikuyae TaxID=13690 RepID=UPI00345E0764